VRFDRSMFGARGYLAGDDARRRDEFARALVEPDVAAIVCARGGYGASRFVHDLDWSSLRRLPRWIVGFSDVTAFHVEATSLAVASVHGPNVTALGRADARAREELLDALERPMRRRTYRQLQSLVQGAASGPLVGGNLTLLHACATAGRLRLPPNSILFLEDVTERPYRIDRMLTTLRSGGHLDSAAGFVLGDFSDCGPGRDGVSVLDVVREVLAPLGKPIAWGLPCGHGEPNVPLHFGASAVLEATNEAAALVLEGVSR
jgi:muramoyltetrapeptide carboxypeptidase